MEQALFSLAGKLVLVTGASSGLGNHFARVLAEAGGHVVAGARRVDRLTDLVADVEARDGRAVALELDVTDQESVESLFESAETSVGPIDVVINCAGVAETGSLLDGTDQNWKDIFEVNLNGLRRVCREAARRMVEAERPGVIVNIASIAGLGAAPGHVAYATSKAAVIHLTKSMATELWKHDIRVNAICPGYFPSEMTEGFIASEQGQEYLSRIPPRRIGQLDELTGPLLLLASGASGYMTGVALPVDGGHSIRMI